MQSCLRQILFCSCLLICVIVALPIYSNDEEALRPMTKRSFYGMYQHVPGYLVSGRNKKMSYYFDEPYIYE
ncbi:unnamed protein product, partial [Mesorhabditis spiculigera]